MVILIVVQYVRQCTSTVGTGVHWIQCTAQYPLLCSTTAIRVYTRMSSKLLWRYDRYLVSILPSRWTKYRHPRCHVLDVHYDVVHQLHCMVCNAVWWYSSWCSTYDSAQALLVLLTNTLRWEHRSRRSHWIHRVYTMYPLLLEYCMLHAVLKVWCIMWNTWCTPYLYSNYICILDADGWSMLPS